MIKRDYLTAIQGPVILHGLQKCSLNGLCLVRIYPPFAYSAKVTENGKVEKWLIETAFPKSGLKNS